MGSYVEIANLIYDHFNGGNEGRVTVIVGAGASASLATNNLKKSLLSRLDKSVFETNAMVHFGRHSDECTLEELFSIYSKLKGEKDAYNFLNKEEIYRRSDHIRPTKGYEFLAHLVHNKLIHNIITTNFDEELEISLDDEMGKENYRIVKSLSEFDAFNMEIEVDKKKAFSKPMLFKVHGTISYPRTIRATIENVKKFENEKHRVLKWILCNTKILIIIGFSFRDEDFKQVFSEALKEKAFKEKSDNSISICWIHKTKNRRNYYEKSLDNMIKRDDIQKIIIKYFILMNSGDFFKKIAEQIEKRDENKKIPTIARQNIRGLILEHSHVFSWDEITGMVNNRFIEFLIQKFDIDWVETANIKEIKKGKVIQVSTNENSLFLILHDREAILVIDDGRIDRFRAVTENHKLNIYDKTNIISNKFSIEIIIFAITVRGLFGIDALTNCIRVQRYCDEIIKNKLSPYDFLQKLIAEGVIKKLNEHSNIYYLPDNEIGNIVSRIINVFKLKDIEKSSELERKLSKQLNKLKEVFDVDVVEPDISVYLMFKKPKAIRDHKEWEEKTKEFVKDANELKIIAQTGEWITKDKNQQYFSEFLKNKNKSIKLITCEKFDDAGMHSNRQDEIEQKILDMQKREGQITIRHLPWSEIFEHIKLSDQKKGMYMKRIAKSSIVAPVWIEGDDCDLLNSMFDYYWEFRS